MSEYARHDVVEGVHGPVAEIRQICLLERANLLLHENLFHCCHLMEQAHFLGVRDPYIGVCVGGRAVRKDERTQVSWLGKRSGTHECVFNLSKHYYKVAVSSY